MPINPNTWRQYAAAVIAGRAFAGSLSMAKFVAATIVIEEHLAVVPTAPGAPIDLVERLEEVIGRRLELNEYRRLIMAFSIVVA